MDRSRFRIYPIFITKNGDFYLLPDTCEELPSKEEAQRLGEPTFPVRLSHQSGFLTRQGLLSIDLVLPVLHGDYGEDGRIQGLLDTVGIPYVGEGALTSAVGADKELTKRLVSSCKIPVVPFTVISNTDTLSDAMQKAQRAGLAFPLFLKPTSLGSSIGATRVENEQMLAEALSECGQYGKLLLEKYITPLYEIELCVIRMDGKLSLAPAAQIVSASGFYDYAEKYQKNTARIDLCPNLPEDTAGTLYAYATSVLEILEVKTLSRIDFFLSGEGEIYFNEINTFPGFTESSLFPKRMEALGFDFTALITHLCEVSYDRDL